MNTCPDCTVTLRANAVSCACGWKAPAHMRPSSAPAEDKTLCTYELLGKRCHEPWVIGRNGRRYCREHDPRSRDHAPAVRVPGGVGDFDALRSLVGAFKAMPPRAQVKAPAYVKGPARPVSEHFGEVPQRRFEDTEDDLPWQDGRE